MITIYNISNNQNFENGALIRKESFNNNGFRMTDIVLVKNEYRELGQMSRDDFFTLVDEGGAYAYQNIENDCSTANLAEIFGWDDEHLWTYIHKCYLY